MRYRVILCVALVYLTSCKEEIPRRSFENPTFIAKGVFVTNEGNFQWGNASVTYYDFADSVANATDLFAQKNNRPLGDICQSMYIYNGKAYLVLNNSSKIEVADAGSFVSLATISGLGSPRYFLPVSSYKAYVTDLYANSVQVVDLQQNKVVKQIPLRGWTEELLLYQGRVYVTNLRTNYLYLINPQTDVLEDSILMGMPSASLAIDKNNQLWALCSQVLTQSASSKLVCLSTDGKSINKTIDLGTDAGKILRSSPSGEYLYYIKTHVYRIGISDNTAPANPFIYKSGSQNFYSLGVEPISGAVFVSDAADYIQRGKVSCYSSNGVFQYMFNSGIIPGNFWFN
jgi:DNA-binding beta-propeller fold protein YncE